MEPPAIASRCARGYIINVLENDQMPDHETIITSGSDGSSSAGIITAVVVIVLLLGGGGWWLFGHGSAPVSSGGPSVTVNTTTPALPAPAAPAPATPAPAAPAQ